MKKLFVILLAALILAIVGFAFYYLGKRNAGETTGFRTAESESTSAAPPLAASQPNPWNKALNVSPGGDIGSIAGAIEKAFDEHQMRRRLILGFWAQGYRADQIAVMTGYRVENVLKAMKNYEKDVEDEASNIVGLVYKDVDIPPPDLALPVEEIRAESEKKATPPAPSEEPD